MINEEFCRQILTENAAQVNEQDVKAYAEKCAENDPGFYRWLFKSDWEHYRLPAECEKEYNDFIDTLPTR